MGFHENRAVEIGHFFPGDRQAEASTGKIGDDRTRGGAGTKDELVRNTIGTKREVVVEFADGSRVTHLIDDAAEMLRVMREAETQGSAVRDLTMKSPSLEKVFLSLTGKGLRE